MKTCWRKKSLPLTGLGSARGSTIKKLNILTFQGLGHYEVDMDRGPRGVGGYEWIRHLCEKNWVTPEVMGHLVFAFSKLKQLNWLKELN